MRRSISLRRQALSSTEVATHSDAIIQKLCDSSLIQGNHIAIYFSFRQEVMAEKLLPWLFEHQKHVYLPVVNAHTRLLHFARYTPESPLAPNRFGILEPLPPFSLCPPPDLDTVITPLVAFTDRCERLGTGAGYYDATFAFLNQAPRPTRPILIGLGYAFQQAPHLSQKPHDIPLNYVITENSIFKRSSSP